MAAFFMAFFIAGAAGAAAAAAFVTLATLAAFAAAGNQARSGEAALDLGSLDVTKGEEIDTNITEATVFLDNADSMEAKAEFDWDTYELQGFTFTKLL